MSLFKNPTIVTITAPTCAGKSTILNALCDLPEYKRIVSFTSRMPRPGEVEGKDYYFISDQEALRLKQTGEAAEYNVFGGKAYGITRTELNACLNSGKTPVVILDPNGVDEFENLFKNTGVGLFKAFVYCEEKVRIARLNARTLENLNRTVAEAVLGQGGASLEERLKGIVETHTHRVQSITGDERTWFSRKSWNVYLPGTDVQTAIRDLEISIASYNRRSV